MAVPSDSVGAVVANTILQFLAVVAVALRFRTRYKARQPLGSDDWTIFISMIFSLGLYSSFMYGVSHGLLGVPWATISPDGFVSFRKIQFAAIIICHFVYGLIKISVVLFYKRIFTIVRSFSIASNSLIGLIVLYIIVSFFTMVFCARGVTSFWSTPAVLEGTQYVLYPPTLITIFAVLDVGLDVLVLSLPIPAIMRLKLSRRRKAAVSGIFLLGAFCLVCSVIRLYYTRSLEGFTDKSIEEKRRLSENNDLWAHIEAYASVFTACLPTLRPMFTGDGDFPRVFGSLKSIFSNSSRSQISQGTEWKEVSHGNGSGPQQGAYYEMNTSHEAHALSNKSSQKLDASNQSNDVILVQNTFTSQRE
ncbi:hypothetical protein G7054_g4412 [Neopestalotiopsis clavispora]|nr:hypothetical protein G7054_g4412 [Neopestalotiopsis clavispora]